MLFINYKILKIDILLTKVSLMTLKIRCKFPRGVKKQLNVIFEGMNLLKYENQINKLLVIF
jgi:hypothetical protein